MKYSNHLTAALFAITSFGAASQASAACVYLKWKNTNAANPIQRVTGRICGNNLAVKMSAGGQSMGWTPVIKVGANTYAGAYTNADVTNNFKLTVHDADKSMNMRISTEYNNGTKNVWFAHFKQQ